MAIEVYWGSGSQYSWRVLLALEWKKIPYESRLLQFSQREHKTPEYLRLNPRGRVPTLKDGDYVVYESIAILTYLDRKFPDPPIFGRTPEEAGRISQVISEYLSYMDAEVERFILPIYFGRIEEKREEIQAAASTLQRELALLESGLGNRAWLADERLTAADLVVYPAVRSLLRAASKESAQPLDLGLLPFERRFPRIVAWMRRVEDIPGYERTYPPHWK